MKPRLLILVLIILAALPSHPAGAAAKLVYQSPTPGSRAASPQATLAFRSPEPLDASTLTGAALTLIGSVSGTQQAPLRLARDGRTALATPEHPFTPGETVQVQLPASLHTRSGQPVVGAGWRFSVAHPAPLDTLDDAEAPTPAATQRAAQPRPAYVTAPANLPVWTISGTAAQLADAPLIFMGQRYWQSSGTTMLYALMLDRNGELVYYRPIDNEGSMVFQRTRPNEVAVYHIKEKAFHLFNNQYQETAIYTAGNGYTTDSHEFIRLANGNVAFMIYNYVVMDMSAYGGPVDAIVTELVLQEQDADHNVVFEWHSFDHIPITDTYRPLDAEIVDYIHGNAIEEDTDGNWLISARHTSEIIKINRSTSAVIWRLGGKQNEFTFDPSTITFHAQHDIRRLPNGHITLFDNWNISSFSETNSHSRGLEFALDEQLKTATLVRAQANTPNTATAAMGSAQVLSDGGMAMGWGSAQNALYSEFDAAGTKRFELDFPDPLISYRAKRFAWTGNPTWPPALVAQSTGISATLYTSWNGATEVAAYRFSTGATPATLAPLQTVSRTGFETALSVNLDSSTCFAQTTALNADQQVIGQSSVVSTGNPACLTRQIFLPLTAHTP